MINLKKPKYFDHGTVFDVSYLSLLKTFPAKSTDEVLPSSLFFSKVNFNNGQCSLDL